MKLSLTGCSFLGEVVFTLFLAAANIHIHTHTHTHKKRGRPCNYYKYYMHSHKGLIPKPEFRNETSTPAASIFSALPITWTLPFCLFGLLGLQGKRAKSSLYSVKDLK